MPSTFRNLTAFLLACSGMALAQTPLAFDAATIKPLETITVSPGHCRQQI
jgi:hypothetical protein